MNKGVELTPGARAEPADWRAELPVKGGALAVALLASSLLAAELTRSQGWRQAALLLIGVIAGIVLYHAAFGFTFAWRAMIRDRRGAGLRAQMLMLALAVAAFLPLLAAGELFGSSSWGALRGAVAPMSIAVPAGAFLFGVGMQLGGGCASGTLFTVGGGSIRMVVTLAAFVLGSVLGAWHWPFWQTVPGLGPFSLLEHFGLAGALLMSFGVFALVWTGSAVLERRRHGDVDGIGPSGAGRWLKGPWPLVAGAVGLAVVNIATLLIAGRPWGVTSAFALWGSKVAAVAGLDVAAWPYWQRPGPAASLAGSVLADVTSVMNIGILLGALAAAGLAGRFAPDWRIPLRSLMAAVLGGMLLGYGARIAYGCNIGAFFSGIASSSLHGWVWFAAAFAGNVVGTRLRPWFGLSP